MDAVSFAATKIQPPRPRAARIARPRLEAAIEAALGTMRVVLLMAPAGFGKTSLLAQCAHVPEGGALGWVSLDEDDDTRRLFACLAASLEPYDLPWRSAPEALGAQVGDEGAGAQRAVAELVNALAAAEVTRGVIVLDDLHRVQSPAFHRLLDALIERLPPRWTLVLATRVEPPLSLARWRAAGELMDIGQEQLRFDADEAAALVRAEAGHALDARADELLARTQGWPAGLRLCLAALRNRPGAGLPARGHAAADRALFDYLASEVLDDMPPALHDFLVRASVLPVLTADRAAAVTGDPAAAERLDEIERRGLFATPLDADERTLVLHDLFRDALDDRLRKRFPGELPTLLLRAAAVEDDPVRRIGFELRAGDWAAAERTLSAHAEDLMLEGGANDVLRLATQFPPAWRGKAPRLLMLKGLAHCLRWQWGEMASEMQAAVEAARAAGDRGALQLAMAYLVAARYATGQGDAAQRLIEELQALEPLEPRAAALLLHGRCIQLFHRNELEAMPAQYALLLDRLEQLQSLFAWWECAAAASWSTLPGIHPLLDRYAANALRLCGERQLPMIANLHSLQAYLHLWAGRIDEAAASMDEARADARWLAGAKEIEVNIAVLELIFTALRGQAEEAMRRLDELYHREDDTSGPVRLRHWHHLVAVFAIRVVDVLGPDAAALRRWGERLEPRPQAPASALSARIAAAEGRWADAAQAFAAVLPHAGRLDQMGQAVELHLRAAHAQLRCGRPEAAAQAMRPALRRMREEQVPGHALMAGAAVLETLAEADFGAALDPVERDQLRSLALLSRRMRGTTGAGRPDTVAAPQASTAAPAVGTAPAAGPRPLLSTREREVLEQLAAGASNKVIARVLDISPHTVKRHVANILDKLALNSRGQAAAWLRANGG